MGFSRRSLLFSAAAIAARAASDRKSPLAPADPAVRCACAARPVVAITRADDRRRMVYDALVAIDDQILPALRLKKRVVIKPNLVTGGRPLAVTHPDTLSGILDYLAERFRGPVAVAEASYDDATANFNQYGYPQAIRGYREVELVDLNAEQRYDVLHLLDRNLRVVAIRMASRLLDPEAFIISAAIPKMHNVVVATLSVKNMAMGAPLHAPGGPDPDSSKRKFHEGVRQTNYSIFLSAQKLAPFWGAAVIDGWEGMEGDGPTDGTAVPSRVAIASTDPLAADRIGLELMGLNPDWIGYLNYCGLASLGQWDLSRIDLRGIAPATVRRTYRLHTDIDRMRLWMEDLPDLPSSNPRLG